MLLSICESYENRRRKYLTFGMSVYDVTLRVYRTVEPCDILKIKNRWRSVYCVTGYTIAVLPYLKPLVSNSA
jgi:hypothetical protein